MLDSVREAITATAVNKRGQVDIVSLHRKDGATQIVFRASPAQSVIFPAMIDQPALARIRSGLIQELMPSSDLRPMWTNEKGDEIWFVGERAGRTTNLAYGPALRPMTLSR